MNKTVSVLIPVYNNEVTVTELFERLVAVLEGLDADFEIIFVNDGSRDRSWSIIRGLAEADPRCVGLNLSRNFGQHPAISAGLERCQGDITVLMDADLQDQPEELPKMLAELDDPDVDIVYTTWTMGDAKGKLSSRLFHSAFSRMALVDLPPNLGTYRAFDRQVLVALLDYPERSAVYGPLMAQMGFGHVYVTVERAAAGGRETSYTFKRRLALATSALISYSNLPHRLVTWIGMTLTASSVLFLIVLVVQYALGNRESSQSEGTAADRDRCSGTRACHSITAFQFERAGTGIACL
jgi:dolichol-phosphate mannosyltransferase